ncbi:FimV domain-containing protein [Acinetobacter sp. Ac_5812]|uniref:FimV domain-containing protein n=1 Tax=Acinetobacter sp. Ac_5812 TaxID=1848937 RepID=UPI0014902B51|nr:FimV domain-containing protein [Acinetobacter sp. Ac_5812]NNP68163.1 FimV domain-containing protein [Acinetobacter sp. Ac_5812]
MSTIIIVLLVIVLIVAIVLKKRESNQANAAPKKGASKTAKKAATRSASRTTLVREEQEYAPPTTTEISESLRQKLEQQIQNGNFQSAEAQINQALKQDNAQHELYLYLLDIHLKQKDDLAIDQLIKHIHALKLEDIAQAAEAKHREYEQNKQPDPIDFNLASHHFQQPSAAAEPQIQNNVADFDALVQAPAAQSFDDLQSEYAAPTEEAKPVETAAEVQPLDFNFSFEQKPTDDTVPSPAPVATPESKEQQPPLEFSFNLEPTPASIEEAKTEDLKPELDFNFTHLEVASQPVEEKAPVEEAAPSLDFNFEPTVEKTEQPAPLETTAFSFDIAEPAAVETQAELITPAATAITIHDPLAQSFPDLQQLDEAQLNLELAEQYIELGAYDSARELLKNNQAFNAEQQQRSENLLNKIAS